MIRTIKSFHKSLFKQLCLYTFCFFLFSSLLINFVIYSLHAHIFLTLDLWSYYLLSETTIKLPIVLTLSFALASIFITYQKRRNFEFLALFTSGVSKKTVLIPFFGFSFFVCSILFINDHFFTSRAHLFLTSLKPRLVSHKKRIDKEKLTILHKKNSKIIYKDYDDLTNFVKDLYVIETPKKIWHFESYDIRKQLAKNIDLIEEKKGFLTKTKSIESKEFKIEPELFSLNHILLDKIDLLSLFSLQKKPFFSKVKKKAIHIQIVQKLFHFSFPILLCFLASGLLLKSFRKGFLIDTGLFLLLFFGYYFLIQLFSSLAGVGIFSALFLYIIPILYLSIFLFKFKN